MAHVGFQESQAAPDPLRSIADGKNRLSSSVRSHGTKAQSTPKPVLTTNDNDLINRMKEQPALSTCKKKGRERIHMEYVPVPIIQPLSRN